MLVVCLVFFQWTLVVATPPAAQCSSSVLCDSLSPLTTTMSDPKPGRGGWINLAKQKNE